jgi:hypothetical protein
LSRGSIALLADISPSIKLILKCNGALQAETQRLFFRGSVFDGKYSMEFYGRFRMMLQTKKINGGAERDRTVGLLNAIIDSRFQTDASKPFIINGLLNFMIDFFLRREYNQLQRISKGFFQTWSS